MKKKISVDEFFAGADFEAVQQEEPEGHHVTLSHPRFDLWRVIRIAAVVLIFLLFFCFLMKQYTYVYPSHDDYGYASIHYHHTAKGATGMDFTMDQISEYPVEIFVPEYVYGDDFEVYSDGGVLAFDKKERILMYYPVEKGPHTLVLRTN